MASSLSQTVLFSVLVLLSFHQACAHQACAKKVHLHFYFHEILQGPNATILTVVKAPNVDPLTFGRVGVMDNMLREGKDENSPLIGRAQGLVAIVGPNRTLLTMLNFIFTEGKYNGSTLALYGTIIWTQPIERVIVGGTGMFRMAEGYSLTKAVFINATYAVYEFDMYVWYKKIKEC